jgi:hypothetical protein
VVLKEPQQLKQYDFSSLKRHSEMIPSHTHVQIKMLKQGQERVHQIFSPRKQSKFSTQPAELLPPSPPKPRRFSVKEQLAALSPKKPREINPTAQLLQYVESKQRN